MKIKLFVIAIAALFIVGSCKKDSTETASPSTPTNTISNAALQANFWKMSAFTSSPAVDYHNNGVMVTDVYASMDTCERDFHYHFISGGSYTNGISLNCTFPLFYSGTYSLDSVNAKVTLVSTTSVTTLYNIITLNANTLKMSTTEVRSGNTYTFTKTFVKE